MNKSALKPDLLMAQRFLDLIHADVSFTFQTFDDNKKRSKENKKQLGHDPFARICHGRLPQHADYLTSLQQQGAGVFVMINEGNGKGRKAGDVVRVRAHFVDLDGAPIDPVMDAALPPHIVVESSPGKWHAYWLANDRPLEQFKERQKALAQKFNGDPTINDLPRVMRLPGFWHLKQAPFQTQIVHPSIDHEASK
jgi:hypothetical protein